MSTASGSSGLAALAALAALAGATAQAQPPTADADFGVWPVRDNIVMLVGGGGNTTVQLGTDGILIVDTKLDSAAEPLLAAVRELSDQPIRYIINTHAHGDHIGGNALLGPAGATISGGNVAGAISDAGEGATIIAHENVLLGIARLDEPPPFPGWPTSTFYVPQKDLYFNGEPIEIRYLPSAHTNGDSLVFFRRSDVISAGDVYNTTAYPVIRDGDGGSIDGVIAALNEIIRITVPRDKQEGGTLVIPGHGRLADEADVVEYRDMVTIIRDRIRAQKAAGMSLDQVRATRPTLDYDGRYGGNERWTPDQFIEAVYRTLAD
jgi:glyoxylase-like metal-dependent hydrolase (beta-lactamase superfamily II)